MSANYSTLSHWYSPSLATLDNYSSSVPGSKENWYYLNSGALYEANTHTSVPIGPQWGPKNTIKNAAVRRSSMRLSTSEEDSSNKKTLYTSLGLIVLILVVYFLYKNHIGSKIPTASTYYF